MTNGRNAAIELIGVTHRYRRKSALVDVTMALAEGEIAGVIGPDGVGKSTLLGLIAGARTVQSGMISVLGGDMRSARHRSKICPRIAYMPQGLGKNLYMDLTVRENLDFFGRLFGQDRTERKIRIGELLLSTGLAPFHHRAVGKLSGGMKQKLGLCCALIHDPDLLVLDEPTTGVDPLSRRQFWDLIARIRRDRPTMSVLVATALMDEAARFDRLFAMNAGEILASGSPDKIMAQVGTSNLEDAFVGLLPADVRQDQPRYEATPRRKGDGEAAIIANGLTRRFGDFTAVDNVSFRIARGEIFGFLGSNGCGKTTTMKMLTGLLPASEGEAWLFGKPVQSHDMSTRMRVGYMSQSFSLYGELSVRQNLALHARLFHLPAAGIGPRITELVTRFGLVEYLDALTAQLPLGVRQRLSLAVAIIHQPEMLILDEPTSGVDPIARDRFWALLIELSREHGVTIFISTHLMNEAMRCDRISLMDAGRVLASDRPAALVSARGVDTLEEAFIAYLKEASDVSAGQMVGTDRKTTASQKISDDTLPIRTSGDSVRNPASTWIDTGRLFAYSRREAMELARDPIRLAFALLGTAMLMLVFGYGITFDVDDLTYAALDGDRTAESRAYLESFSGSRYFVEKPPIDSQAEMDRRMQSGDIILAIEIPPDFGRDLLSGRNPAVAAWIDGAMPFRAETVRGYLDGLHQSAAAELSRSVFAREPAVAPAEIEARFRYNQDFKSIFTMVPINMALLLIFIPSVLTALGVVREKELGSITNLYVTPVTRLEFLLGKQLPYVVIGMINFLIMLALSVFLFGVPVKGSLIALSLGALLYVGATTGLGLLISGFTRTQIAALFATAIATMVPATLFSGMMQPVASLEGGAMVIGQLFPTSYFMIVTLGTFAKALDLATLVPQLVTLAAFLPALTLASTLLLRKQER